MSLHYLSHHRPHTLTPYLKWENGVPEWSVIVKLFKEWLPKPLQKLGTESGDIKWLHNCQAHGKHWKLCAECRLHQLEWASNWNCAHGLKFHQPISTGTTGTILWLETQKYWLDPASQTSTTDMDWYGTCTNWVWIKPQNNSIKKHKNKLGFWFSSEFKF